MDKLISDKLKEAQAVKDDPDISMEDKKKKIGDIFGTLLDESAKQFDVDNFLKRKKRVGGLDKYASKHAAKKRQQRKAQKVARKKSRK